MTIKLKIPLTCQGIHKRLKDVLDLVHAKRPLLEYQVEKTVSHNPDLREVSGVTVWQDGQKVGTIDSRCTRFSETNGTNTLWYALESHNIRKERGQKNTKFCKDAKTAARTVVEMFTKRTLAELGERLISVVKSEVNSLHQRFEHDYCGRYAIGSTNAEVMNILMDLYEDKVPVMSHGMKTQIVKLDMQRKRDNYVIATNVVSYLQSKNAYVIETMQDETLLCAYMADPATTSKHKSTYDLAPFLQEKFTMLKLLEPRQFAADIGVKFEWGNNKDRMIYFIVGGETKVM